MHLVILILLLTSFYINLSAYLKFIYHFIIYSFIKVPLFFTYLLKSFYYSLIFHYFASIYFF
jgi:hypothetical protein